LSGTGNNYFNASGSLSTTTLDDIWATLAHSSYHALQVKFRKRYSNGVQFLLSYTFSKTIDDISAVAAYGNQAPRLHGLLQPAAGQVDFGGGPDARLDVQLFNGNCPLAKASGT
jgi:hypothetical protein